MSAGYALGNTCLVKRSHPEKDTARLSRDFVRLIDRDPQDPKIDGHILARRPAQHALVPNPCDRVENAHQGDQRDFQSSLAGQGDAKCQQQRRHQRIGEAQYEH